MDSLSSPRLGRRARYDSFPLPPHFPDPNYSPERHHPFASFAPHPAAPTPPAIPRNQYYEPWVVHAPGDLSSFPSSHHSNPSGLDLRYPSSSPRVSDRAIHRVPPNGKHLMPEFLGVGRGGGAVGKTGVFDERPDRFQPNDSFFELGYPDGALVSRRRLEPEQDRLLWDESGWKSRRPVRFSDERESRYRDPFLEQLPPVAAPLEPAPPPLPSPRGLRGVGAVKSSGGEASSVFVHRHPPSSPRFFGRSFSDPKVVKSSVAMPGNSQAIGNGPGYQRFQAIHKKKNNARAVPPERGLGGRQFSVHKSMKKSDPITATKEDGFRSSYHIGISSMDDKHEFKEDCYTGKRKMPSTRVSKYNENSVKRSMQKPSAFSRIQSGLSVWERLEEKPLTLSPPCPLPSPRISTEAKAKANILDPSFESNTLAPKVLDPFIAELSSIEKNLFIEKPTRVMKKKNMIQRREKTIIPIVSSLPGCSRTSNIVMKKKKKKNMIHTREKVVIPIASCSPGSIAKQGVARNSNASSLGSAPALLEANKAEESSRMPESKSRINARTKKVKKLAANKMSGAEAAKMSSRVDGCIIEAPKMEDVMEIPKHEGVINWTKEISYCTPNGDTGTDPINESHLQIYRKIQTKQATPTDNIRANIITTDFNQARDIAVEILDDSAEESLKLGEKLDNIGQGSLNFDVSICSQSSEYIIDNLAANDTFMNMEENGASNSIEQIKSRNSPPRKIKQDVPPPDTAASPEWQGAGEVFVSGALKCSSAEIEMEREAKHQEKTVFITETMELEVPGDYASSYSCIHAPQAPSFLEINNSAPEKKLHGEGDAKENNMIPQSVSDMNFQDVFGTLTIDSCGKKIVQALEPMEMGSPAAHFENMSQSNQSLSEIMDFNEHSGNGNPEHGSKGEAFVSSMVSNSLELEHESVKTVANDRLMPEKAQLSPSPEHRKQVSLIPKLTDEEPFCIKMSPLSGVPRSLSNRPNFSASLKETARGSQTGRHRTWLRANTNTPSFHSDENLKLGGISSKQFPKKLGKIQSSSYFRKGNSLIRKLAAERSPVLSPTVDSSSRKFKYITEGSTRVFRSEYPNNVAPSYPVFERSKTPPLPPLSKLSGFTMNSHSDLPQLKRMDRSPEPVADQGNQQGTPSTSLVACNSESNQDTASCKTVEIANGKRVIYVKRNLNQLVAAPRTENGDSCKVLTEKFQKPVHHPIKKSKKMPFSSSYLYYRSKRNQLIRNASSSDSNLVGIPADNTNSVDSLKQGNSLPHKKRIDNVLQKAKKASRSSLVWTLGGNKLSQKSITTSLCQSVFPYIFPWKRTGNWKSFITANSTPISSRSSVSLISRELQCLRKRNTIYKISTNGFSLRKAGIVGIGGSSLKWSKSIEKRSKKASEEATLAVAEVERKLREKKRSKSTGGNGKNKVSSSCRSISGIELKRGERIFRVGSARYKMDASKRTLLRIPDDHSSSPGNQQQGNSSRISFVPKRLIIGNNEYIQIGNGDQLVRDPKKLKRILANDKVRWSLHSARLRLAQKHQYCLFFTRFGKCNKSGRKCPYIHDPTKVAICTKFLKDQCSDTNCKLTHKVIPERMPDCSYFLKGLCTNINCPYRHVKVNVNAPLCDGFLRGHCADGDECHKKHSYTCPLFEATGKCPQGSLCKLHHPKIQTKPKKRKRIEIQSNSQGRYFYSGEPLGVPSSQNDLAGGNNIFCSNGRLTEYINLDVDDDDVAIQNDESYTGKLDSGYLDFQSCDIDALIKPVRIMHSDDLAIF